MRNIPTPRLTYANVGVTVALVLATTGFAVAAIPSAGGVIRACYKQSGGTVRLVDLWFVVYADIGDVDAMCDFFRRAISSDVDPLHVTNPHLLRLPARSRRRPDRRRETRSPRRPPARSATAPQA